ncbi:MAG: iron ABC transporter permease [Candidatus Methanomethylophilaceae archaeon]|nr:iron ABC transporter permease [Candidatus Methanomethylophilaceae archaeon]
MRSELVIIAIVAVVMIAFVLVLLRRKESEKGDSHGNLTTELRSLKRKYKAFVERRQDRFDVSAHTISENVAHYRSTNRRRALYIVAIIAVIVVLSIFSVSRSTLSISFFQAYDLIVKHIMGTPLDGYMEELRTTIIFDYNMPRTLGAILVGASLAISGAVMQSITRNSLTDSYTIGISSAAMLGVTIGIVYDVCIIPVLSGDLAAIFNAFIFALIPSAAIIVISSFKKMSPTMMILIGIGIMYMFSAFSTFIKFNADAEDLQRIYEWGVGTLTDVHWPAILPMVAGTVIISVLGMVLANRINVLGSGENMSLALGVKPVITRIICFLGISVATGICVCFTGTIGFVGLVAPHIARLFVGSDNKILIPTSAVLGALLILGSDVLVRMLPGGLPVGVITALIGSPIFLVILYRQRRNAAF